MRLKHDFHTPSRRTALKFLALGAAAAMATESSTASAEPPLVRLKTKSIFRMWIKGNHRHIVSNDIPGHLVGKFPDRGCPNTIQAQNFHFRMELHPKHNGQLMPLAQRDGAPIIFGVALDGAPFDPGTAMYWHGNRHWAISAMTSRRGDLGFDNSHAHVQPYGPYHYHGVPTELIYHLHGWGKVCLIGYAADGFPIYGPWGYTNAKSAESDIKMLRASYRLKQGNRPNPPDGPGGQYDGTYTSDFDYVPGLGDLDKANDRYGVTPEYSAGTYYYVITESFPFVPRFFVGTPDRSFYKGPPKGRFGPPGGGPGRPGGPGFGGFGRGPGGGGPGGFGGGPGGFGGGSFDPPGNGQ